MIKKLKEIDQEVIHFHNNYNIVSSKGSILTLSVNEQVTSHQMPRSLLDFFSPFRIFRRLLRLDKCNVFNIGQKFERFLVVRQGKAYIFDAEQKTFEYKFSLKNCRNVLHNSICELPSGKIIFGEYGANRNLAAVPIHLSINSGKSWEEVYLFSPGEIKHIHCVSWDPYTGEVWVMTGDYEGQCKILVCDEELNIKECMGDGGQDWRTCGVVFEKDFVYWFMDSPLQPSSLVRYSRSDRSVEKLYHVDGPVWYIKKLSDGVVLAAVSVEPGPSVKTNSAQIIASRDYINWHIVGEFEKDKWSMKFFKYGVLCFSEGNQYSTNFSVFGEALKNFDGCSRIYSIDKESL